MSNDIIAQLKGLKLHGMASTWPVTMPRFHVQQKFANSCLYGGSNVREASAKAAVHRRVQGRGH